MKHIKIYLLPILAIILKITDVSAFENNTNNTISDSKDSADYELIWSDEFNKEGAFDSKKWNYSPRGKVAWNKYLTEGPKYVYQNDGDLVLRMDAAQIEGDSLPYHSAGIQTLGKFSLRYGKVEVRAKFTQGRGSWPAIWMMPDPAHSLGNWPAGGEIDIMEHVNNEAVVHQTVHNTAMTEASGASKATKTSPYNINDYNTYSIIWTAKTIDFYVNDVLRYSYKKTENAGVAEWPFDVPFYIILNQSGGAGWPGPITDADLPFSMQVDYVRVYKPTKSAK